MLNGFYAVNYFVEIEYILFKILNLLLNLIINFFTELNSILCDHNKTVIYYMSIMLC